MDPTSDPPSLTRAHRRLLALTAIGEAVNRSLDLDEVLAQALEQTLAVLELDAADIRLLAGNRLEIRAARGLSPAFLASEAAIPLGFCYCGHAAQSGGVALVDDMQQLPLLATSACACESFGAVVSIPIRATDAQGATRVVGLLHGANRVPRAFDADDRALLTAVGDQIGAAVARALLHEELKALNRELEGRVAERTAALLATQEVLAEKAEQLRQMLVGERRIEERTRARVAHDLHDGVQQLIIGALFELQAAREVVAGQPDAALERLAAIQGLLRQLETEMRAAIYSLRPMALDAHGLAPALRECVTAFERTNGIPCSLHLSGQARRLDPDAELVAFRIVQEALNNAEAHARAAHLEVRLCFEAGRMTIIRVSDDGCGFDVAEVKRRPRSHLGLIGMRQRAEAVGGSLEVWSAPGQGTQVTLVLPENWESRAATEDA